MSLVLVSEELDLFFFYYFTFLYFNLIFILCLVVCRGHFECEADRGGRILSSLFSMHDGL